MSVDAFLNIAVCKTQMPPFPNIRRVGLTFDLDLWPTDLNVNRDHLLIKDYLPTKFEASGAKCSRVIRCTRFERLTWPWTLDLVTWLSIGIIYSSRTIYLPSLKLMGQSVVELSVAQGLEDWHDLWLWPTDLTINRDHLLIKDYLHTEFEAIGTKRCWVIRCTRFERLTWPLTLTFDLTINRDHLLIKDYLPTKFEACGAKRCWVIRCTRFGRLAWPLTLTFDLLTWLSIGIIYSSKTIYLPSLKLLGQSVVELSVAQGLRDWHDLWPWPLTYWPDYQ